MNARPLSLAAALLVFSGVGRADVSLEYSFTAGVSKLPRPIMTEHIQVKVTPTRAKTRIWAEFSGALQTLPITIPADMKYGIGFTEIQRFDDDRFIVYNSLEDNIYHEDTIEGALKTLRLDPWKELAPNRALAEQAPPGFTAEQIDRMGAEARAVYMPYVGKVWRIYYRPLTEARSFNGQAGKGYRMTWLINGGGVGKAREQWLRIALEWWVTPPAGGDEALAAVQQACWEKRQAVAFPTTSMWSNEMAPVLWAALPQAVHDAAATVMQPDGGVAGVLQQLSIVVSPPPSDSDQIGDAHFELTLNNHDNTPIAPTAFDPPADFVKLPLVSPFDDLKQLVPKDMLKTMGIPNKLGLGWRAWNAASDRFGRALPCPVW